MRLRVQSKGEPEEARLPPILKVQGGMWSCRTRTVAPIGELTVHRDGGASRSSLLGKIGIFTDKGLTIRAEPMR